MDTPAALRMCQQLSKHICDHQDFLTATPAQGKAPVPTSYMQEFFLCKTTFIHLKELENITEHHDHTRNEPTPDIHTDTTEEAIKIQK